MDGVDGRPALRASNDRHRHRRNRILRAASRDAYGSGARDVGGVAADPYRSLVEAVDEELERCGRPRASVTIVGVSKRQPVERVAAVISAGLADIGENYLQEARAKFPLLFPQRTGAMSAGTGCAGVDPPVRKHFIGHLQTNKAKAVVQLFDVVQSVDRLEAGEALARAARDAGKALPVLLQVNVSPAERFGCPPERAPRLADALRGLEGLRLDGVMAIGPNTSNGDEISRAFELAAKTFAMVGGSTLSIGMSGDWQKAIRAGSTMIRIGTALFGGRPLK